MLATVTPTLWVLFSLFNAVSELLNKMPAYGSAKEVKPVFAINTIVNQLTFESKLKLTFRGSYVCTCNLNEVADLF